MAKAHGILKIIEPCAHVLEVNFPLQRDDGSFEMAGLGGTVSARVPARGQPCPANITFYDLTS